MYCLFCLSGALYYFSHPDTLSVAAAEYTQYTLHILTPCLLWLMLTQLSGAAASVCTVCFGLPLPPRARKSLRPGRRE